MAKRVQAMCQLIVDTYDGDAARVWTTAADGKELLKRVAAPGLLHVWGLSGLSGEAVEIEVGGRGGVVTSAGWDEGVAGAA
jgi:hypothetical protein